jgi:hypothetical protein
MINSIRHRVLKGTIFFYLTPACLTYKAHAAEPHAGCLTQAQLNRELQGAVSSVDFTNIIDLGPNFTNDQCPRNEPACQHGRSTIGLRQFPQLEVAVIAFQPECHNTVVGSNLFYSRDFPQGIAATFDNRNQSVNNVRMYKWEQERFDGGKSLTEAPWFKDNPTAWSSPFPAGMLLNPDTPRSAPQFMSPYPASVFKVLVAIRVLQTLEEQGTLSEMLQRKYTYNFGTESKEDDVTLTFQQFLDAMIQWSGNYATAAMIQYLHSVGDIVESPVKNSAGYPLRAPRLNRLNQTFAEIGLPSLQMNRTRGLDGLWGNRLDPYDMDSSSLSHIHMPAWDTARLLWYMRTLADTPQSERPRWHVGQGLRRVNTLAISDNVKRHFWANLKNQLFHEVLSNTIHCEQELGGPLGIPAIMPSKWINNGQLRLPLGTFPFSFPPDELEGNYEFTKRLPECQQNAEVEFASKTGLTSVSGSHAGLVKGLSERGFRREYIVVLNSSLGSRFTDSERLDSDRVIPCFDKTLCYSSRVNQLGANIDMVLSKWLEPNNDVRKKHSEISSQ